MNRRALIGAVLVVAVVASGWLAIQLRPERSEPVFVGPPRADYTMEDYQLVVLDADGAESFTVSGPQMARDPISAEMTLQQPLFTIPTEDGTWTATSLIGWVSATADEVRLTRSVALDGPPDPEGAPLRVRTESLSFRPDDNTAHSGEQVNIERANSIHSGTGMDADLDSRRLQLHANVRTRHVPANRR